MRHSSRLPDRILTAPKFSYRPIRVPRTARPATARTNKYRDELLQIEMELKEKLKENEMMFGGSKELKKMILLETIEEISHTKYGFTEPLIKIINKSRKNAANVRLRFLRTTSSNLFQAKTTFKQIQNEYQQVEHENSQLKAEIKREEEEIEQMKQHEVDMKQKLFIQSDLFAQFRQTSKMVKEIQKEYDEMFVQNHDDSIYEEFNEFETENNVLKRELRRLKNEYEICAQISKHMKIRGRMRMNSV